MLGRSKVMSSEIFILFFFPEISKSTKAVKTNKKHRPAHEVKNKGPGENNELFFYFKSFLIYD